MIRTLTVVFIVSIFFGCSEKKPIVISTPPQNPVIQTISYSVVKYFPHDTNLFTEGLLFHDGQLFESTGSPGGLPQSRSLIGIIDTATGKMSVKEEIDRTKYFGEGIVFFNDKLYQLTYKNNIGFIYDAKSFKQLGTFHYSNPEGWSLTTDGTNIIMDDGTDKLTYLSPENLQPIKTLSVTENGIPVNMLNELEYIKGFIYANIWKTDIIVKIDPSNGKVVAHIDLSPLAMSERRANPNAEVLNGIAYDSVNDRIFVTGKLWSKIYEISISH